MFNKKRDREIAVLKDKIERLDDAVTTLLSASGRTSSELRRLQDLADPFAIGQRHDALSQLLTQAEAAAKQATHPAWVEILDGMAKEIQTLQEQQRHTGALLDRAVIRP